MEEVEKSIERIRQKSLEIHKIVKETEKINENVKGMVTELDNLRFHLLLKKRR